MNEGGLDVLLTGSRNNVEIHYQSQLNRLTFIGDVVLAWCGEAPAALTVYCHHSELIPTLRFQIWQECLLRKCLKMQTHQTYEQWHARLHIGAITAPHDELWFRTCSFSVAITYKVKKHVYTEHTLIFTFYIKISARQSFTASDVYNVYQIQFSENIHLLWVSGSKPSMVRHCQHLSHQTKVLNVNTLMANGLHLYCALPIPYGGYRYHISANIYVIATLFPI